MSLWPIEPSEIKEYLCTLWKNDYSEQGCLPLSYTWKHVKMQLSEIKYGKPNHISKNKINEIINQLKSGKPLPPLICLNCELIDGYHRGYGNMSKYRDKDDWPTCIFCQGILRRIKERKDIGLRLHDISGDRYEVNHLEIYETGDLTGYIQGYIIFTNRDKAHEFLYRVHDPKNGSANTLVSIDFGYLNSLVAELWQEIENGIKQSFDNFMLY